MTSVSGGFGGRVSCRVAADRNQMEPCRFDKPSSSVETRDLRSRGYTQFTLNSEAIVRYAPLQLKPFWLLFFPHLCSGAYCSGAFVLRNRSFKV